MNEQNVASIKMNNTEFKFNAIPKIDQQKRVEAMAGNEGKPGLQGALLLAPDFVAKGNAEQMIKQKLDATDMKVRWNFRELNKVSRSERKGTGVGFEQWQKQIKDYLKYYKNNESLEANDHYNIWKDLICKTSGINHQDFDKFISGEVVDGTKMMRRIALALYNKDGSGTEKFIKATLDSDRVEDPKYQVHIREVAKVIFGDKYTDNILLQIQTLEKQIAQPTINKTDLAKRILDKTKKLTAEEKYIISEIKKFLNKDSDFKKNNEQLNIGSREIVVKQNIGGKEEQEDYILTRDRKNPGGEKLPEGVESIAILADGHGIDGKIASQTTAQFFEAYFIEYKNNNPAMSVEDAISSAIKETEAEDCKVAPGGGSTLTAAIRYKGKVYIAHVGDSRATIIDKNGAAHILTKDHTWKERGESKYKYNIQLSRTIGDPNKKIASDGKITSKPDIIVVDEKNVSKIILCSDGLYNKVDSEQIRKDIQSSYTMEEASRKIMERVRDVTEKALADKKEPDNTSLDLIQI